MNSNHSKKISARFQQASDVISLSLQFIGDPEKTGENNLTAALSPEIIFLLRVLIDDEYFIGDVLSKCSEELCDSSESYVKLLLLIAERLPFEDSNVCEKWFTEDLMGTTVIDLLLKHLPAITGQIMSFTFTYEISYPCYDHIFTKLRKLLSIVPVKCFSVLENCLISNILSESIICSLLASDLWYFLLLQANEDLRLQHCKLLLKLTKITSGCKYQNVKIFLERILALMNQSQIEQLMTEFNPMKYPAAWSKSYGCQAENELCISFLQNYDCRKTYSNVLPLISSFISKDETLDKKYRDSLIFILLIALKHSIEAKKEIHLIPGLLNTLSEHTTYLHRDVILSLSYSLCYSDFNENDSFKYLFCHLCNLFIRSATTFQQRGLFECLVKCCSEPCLQHTRDLLYGHLLYLCTVHENLDNLCPLINSKPEVREGLIEFIETKKNDHLNPMVTDEIVSLIQKIFTNNHINGA